MTNSATDSYNVEIGGSVADSLRKSLDEVERRFARLNKTLSGLSGAAWDRQAAAKTIRDFEKLTGTDRESRRASKVKKMVEGSYTPDVWRKEMETAKKLVFYEDALEQKIKDVTSAKKELVNVTDDLLDRERKISKVRQDDDRLHRTRDQLRSVGRGAVAVGAGMSAAGAGMLYGAYRPIQTAGDFQKAQLEMEAKGDFSKDPKAKAKQLSDLRSMAHSLGFKTGQGSKVTMQGMKEMVAAGMSPEDVLKAMPSVANLALSSNMDLAKTADLSTNVMSQFGMDASKMKEFANIGATFSNRSEADFGDFAQAMIYGGSTASGLGISLEDTAGLMAALRSKGIGAGNASMMGTVTSDILSRIVTSTGSDRATLEGHGIDIDNANKDIIGTITTLAKSMNNLPDAEKQQQLKAIFGIEGSRGMNSLMKKGTDGKMAIEEARAHSDAMKAARGGDAAENMTTTVTGGFLMNVSKLSAAFESLLTRVGEPLLSPLTKVVDIASRLVQGLSDILDESSELSKSFPILSSLARGASSVLLPVVGIFGGLLLVTGLAVTAIGSMAIAAGAFVHAVRVLGLNSRAGRFAQLTGRGGRSSRMLSGFGTGNYNGGIYDSSGRIRKGLGGRSSGWRRGLGNAMRGGRGVLGAIAGTLSGGLAGGLFPGGSILGEIGGIAAETTAGMAAESLVGRLFKGAKGLGGKALGGMKWAGSGLMGLARGGLPRLVNLARGAASWGAPMLGGLARTGSSMLGGLARGGGSLLSSGARMAMPMLEGLTPMITGAFAKAAPMIGRMFSMAGPIGLMVGAGIAGWQIGTWLDSQLGLSEAIAEAIFGAKFFAASNKHFAKVGEAMISSSKVAQSTKGKGDVGSKAARQAEIDRLTGTIPDIDAKLSQEKADLENMQAWYLPLTRMLYEEHTKDEITNLGLEKDNVMGRIDHLKFQQESGGYDYNLRSTYNAKTGKMDKTAYANSDVRPEDQATVTALLEKLNKTLNPDSGTNAAAESELRSRMAKETAAHVSSSAAMSSGSKGSTTIQSEYNPTINLNGAGMADVQAMVKRAVNQSLGEYDIENSRRWANDFDDTAELG